MSKLNKIFLAVIVALLVTAVCEVIFIFVYKPTQSIPVPQALVVTNPSPTPIQNPAITNYMVDYLKTIRYWTNETYTYTEEVSGTISSIILPAPANNNILTIYLQGVKGKAVTQYNVMPPLSQSIKAYDFINGTQTPIKLTELSAGNQIMITAIYDMHTSNGKMPNNVEIERFLK